MAKLSTLASCKAGFADALDLSPVHGDASFSIKIGEIFWAVVGVFKLEVVFYPSDLWLRQSRERLFDAGGDRSAGRWGEVPSGTGVGGKPLRGFGDERPSAALGLPRARPNVRPLVRITCTYVYAYCL